MQHKRCRLGSGENGCARFGPECLNHIWAWDLIFDRDEGARSLKWLGIICEFTRECHTLHPERHLTALDVIDELMRLIELLNAESFANLSEAQALARIWKRQYNEQRPHSSLGYLTPAEFAAGQPDPPLGATPLAPGQAPLPKEQRTLIAAGA